MKQALVSHVHISLDDESGVLGDEADHDAKQAAAQDCLLTTKQYKFEALQAHSNGRHARKAVGYETPMSKYIISIQLPSTFTQPERQWMLAS
jgi:hypothetical protein